MQRVELLNVLKRYYERQKMEVINGAGREKNTYIDLKRGEADGSKLIIDFIQNLRPFDKHKRWLKLAINRTDTELKNVILKKARATYQNKEISYLTGKMVVLKQIKTWLEKC